MTTTITTIEVNYPNLDPNFPRPTVEVELVRDYQATPATESVAWKGTLMLFRSLDTKKLYLYRDYGNERLGSSAIEVSEEPADLSDALLAMEKPLPAPAEELVAAVKKIRYDLRHDRSFRQSNGGHSGFQKARDLCGVSGSYLNEAGEQIHFDVTAEMAASYLLGVLSKEELQVIFDAYEISAV